MVYPPKGQAEFSAISQVPRTEGLRLHALQALTLCIGMAYDNPFIIWQRGFP